MCVSERERVREKLRTLLHTRIKNLGRCLFLQSIPANLHAKRERDRDTQKERETETDRELAGDDALTAECTT